MVAMVTKMAAKNRLKIEKLPFWSKFETCNRGINIEHKQIPKHILTDYENDQGTQYIKRFFFWYLLALISNSSKIGLQKPQI